MCDVNCSSAITFHCLLIQKTSWAKTYKDACINSTHIHTYIHTYRQAGRQPDRQTDRQIDTDGRTDGWTDSQTDRQTDRHTCPIASHASIYACHRHISLINDIIVQMFIYFILMYCIGLCVISSLGYCFFLLHCKAFWSQRSLGNSAVEKMLYYYYCIAPHFFQFHQCPKTPPPLLFRDFTCLNSHAWWRERTREKCLGGGGGGLDSKKRRVQKAEDLYCFAW